MNNNNNILYCKLHNGTDHIDNTLIDKTKIFEKTQNFQ